MYITRVWVDSMATVCRAAFVTTILADTQVVPVDEQRSQVHVKGP